MNFGYLIAATLIGAAFATQPAINAVAARGLGSSVAAAALSVAITLTALLSLMPIFGGTLRPAALIALPWWVVFGGLIGAVVVAGAATIAPITGAALFIVCMIAGQLLGSTLIDHFGAFGFEQRPVSLMKSGGLALIVCGVVLVRAG